MKTIIQNIKTVIILVAVLFSMNLVYAAWSEPTANPTNNNAPAPINVSGVSQTKVGSFWADGGLFTGAGGYFGGNVGIGAQSPYQKLHLVGDMELQAANGNTGTIYFSRAANTVRSRIQAAGSGETGTIDIQTTSNGQGTWNHLFMDSSGNVGIGTTNPGVRLEVAGQIKITGGSPGVGKVLTSDANGVASWQQAAGTSSNLPLGPYYANAEFQNNTGHKLLVTWRGVSCLSGGWGGIKQLGFIGETSANIQVAAVDFDIPGSGRINQSASMVVPNGWKWKITNTFSTVAGCEGGIGPVYAWEID